MKITELVVGDFQHKDFPRQWEICYFIFDRTRMTSGPHYEKVEAPDEITAREEFNKRHQRQRNKGIYIQYVHPVSDDDEDEEII